MSNIIVFDLETIGFPDQLGYDLYYLPNQSNHYDKARMIELGYQLYSNTGVLLKENSYLIKPNGFSINNSKIHGITNEMASMEGVELEEALSIFETDLKDVGTLVSHNILFDYNILLSECYRINNLQIITKLESIKKECSMKIGKQIMRQRKSPKLVELYKYLFDKEFNQNHRARSDTRGCAECYFEMKKD